MKILKTLSSFLLLTLALVAFVACGDKSDDHDHDHDHGDGDHKHADGDHDHDHDDEGHDHDGDDHDHEDGDDHGHGEKVVLGEAMMGKLRIKAAVLGHIEAGEEAVLDYAISGDDVHAVRTWVGDKSAKGAMKAKLGMEKGNYHGHIEVAEKLPEGSMVWLEIESEDGTKQTVSFPLPKNN